MPKCKLSQRQGSILHSDMGGINRYLMTTQPTTMRPFFIIWTGQAFSLLGSRLVQFALIWWLTITTGSATVLALASMVALLPQVFLGPWAGVLVDRWPRRSILIAADSAIALATLFLALLFGLGMAQIWHIYTLMFIRALAEAFHWPAMQASTTLMVPEKELTRVGGLNQTLAGIASIVIPPLGALILGIFPMQGILAIDITTAGIAILSLAFISIPQPPQLPKTGPSAEKPSIWVDMRAGLQFVLGWRGLLFFAGIGTLSNMLGRAAGALTPLVVTEHFAGGALELGWLQAAVGVGSVLGGLTLGLWGGFERRIVTAMLALTLDGIAIMVFGLTPANAFLLAVIAIFLVGFMEAMVLGLNGAIFQAIVPPEMQGRVFSLLISVGGVAAPMGLAIAGPVADRVGAQTWWLMAGLMITLVGLGAFFVPSLMRIETGHEVAEDTKIQR